MMRREIVQFFINWKERPNRKPLIVRGARQVGKTFAIEQFGKQYFTNYLKINLEERLELHSIFKKNNTKTIIEDLSIVLNKDITPGKTLLFIDEIQSCPEAIITLRYFYEQFPNLHVIAAGSLLDHTLKEINFSMPVGRIEFCYMYPMSFKEFLWALSENKLVTYLENFKLENEINEAVHIKLLEILRLYFFIGGMPEAVQLYISQNKLIEIERTHANILTSLQHDFAKYGTRKQQEYLNLVLQYCAKNTGKKVKYVNVDHQSRSKYLKDAFNKLELSRLVHLIKHTNAKGIPITNNVKDEVFKPLFLDIGLSNHLGQIRLIEIPDIMTINEGAIAEQFIGQELLTLPNAYIDSKLYYWVREAKSTNAEIDYLYQSKNTIIPVEVKAGKTGSLKSLHVYLFEKKNKTGIRFNTDKPSIGTFKTKIRIGKSTEEVSYKLISLPLYMCFILPKIK